MPERECKYYEAGKCTARGENGCNRLPGSEICLETLFEALNKRKKKRFGHWIEKPYLFGTSRFCSLCGSNYGMPHEIYNFCPNCGAEMDGVKND